MSDAMKAKLAKLNDEQKRGLASAKQCASDLIKSNESGEKHYTIELISIGLELAGFDSPNDEIYKFIGFKGGKTEFEKRASRELKAALPLLTKDTRAEDTMAYSSLERILDYMELEKINPKNPASWDNIPGINDYDDCLKQLKNSYKKQGIEFHRLVLKKRFEQALQDTTPLINCSQLAVLYFKKAGQDLSQDQSWQGLPGNRESFKQLLEIELLKLKFNFDIVIEYIANSPSFSTEQIKNIQKIAKNIHKNLPATQRGKETPPATLTQAYNDTVAMVKILKEEVFFDPEAAITAITKAKESFTAAIPEILAQLG